MEATTFQVGRETQGSKPGLKDEPGLVEPMYSSGITPRLWRLYAQAWLVCLFFPLFSLLTNPVSPLRLFLSFSGLVVFIALYSWFMWPYPLNRSGSPNRLAPVLLAVLTLLVLGLTLAYDPAFLWLMLGVSAVAGRTLPARPAFWSVMVFTLVTLGTSIVLSGDPTRANWYQIVPLVLLVRGLGLDMLGFTRLAQALLELHAARAELARLAVVEERLRLARDLHDLLGQKLSTITLKSALAARLAENEPGRAALEMREVEEVARQTLREVREAVGGYRQPRLESEINAACSLLEAAGISLKVEESLGEVDTFTNSAFAWAIREGVTNLVRHSRARWCSIKLARENGLALLELVNDGIGEKPGKGVISLPGNGLVGLAERVGALEGKVEAGPVNAPGKFLFRLRVELPLEKSRTSQKEQGL